MNVGYPSDDDFENARRNRTPPSEREAAALGAIRCGRHACTDHRECLDACNVCKCSECALALEAHQRAPIPHRQLDAIARDRSPIDLNQSDDAKRKAFADLYERETAAAFAHANRQDAIAATGLYCPTEDEIANRCASDPPYIVPEVTPLPPPPVFDPTTEAISEQNRERDRMRAEIEHHVREREKLDRAAREEVARLHRQVDELTRQRDAAEERFQEANHLHGETSAALSAMTIKWLNLGNEAKALLHRVGEAPPPGYRAGSVAELRIANRRMGEVVAANNEEFVELRRQIFQLTQDAAKRRVRFDECEAACWEALERIPTEVCRFTERGAMDVEVAVEMGIEALIESRETWLRNCTAANGEINADRAALAAGAINIGSVTRERDALREQARRNDVMIATMGTVTDKAREVAAEFSKNSVEGMWSPLVAVLCELVEAVKAYDAASPASADPDQIDMPF